MGLIKKMIIGILLIVFVLSITQVVLADIENNKTENKLEDDLVDKLKERRDDLREKNVDRQKDLAQARAKAAEAKEKFEDARERFSEAKERYQEAKDRYQEHRVKVVDFKTKVRDCNEDCEDKKDNLKKGVRNHLIKTGELIERSIEKLINRLDNAPISDEEKESATTTLLALQEKITLQKEIVEAMAENASNEELREAVADLKSTWKEVKQVQHKVISSLTQAKLSKLTDKHQEYLNGMNLRIETLSDEGKDVTELERIRDMFEKHIEQFNLDFAKAENLWDEADSGKDVLRELQNAQKQLKDEISKTKRLLKEFMSKFRELNKDVEEPEAEDDSPESEE